MAGEAGIQQFVDIGSGLPTQGNVHEIARAVNPATKTVYIDSDPVVVTHGRALLADNRTAIVLEADARQGGALLEHPEIREYLDFDRPIGLLLFALLHHLKDSDDPAGITASLRASLPAGSGLAISHFHNPGAERPEVARRAAESERVFNETLGTGRWRTYDEIAGYFGDMAMADPGLGPLAEWRPDPGDVPPKGNVYYTLIGGVAHKA
jgi:S-adenosyl methyltransferase